MNIFKAAYLPVTIPTAIFLVVIFFLALRAYKVYADVNGYKVFWEELSQSTSKNEFITVTLGDSTMQALGATKPLDGVAGKTMALTEKQLGKKVQMINVSVSGAKVKDLIEHQLPKIEGIEPDLVIVSIGANDAIRQSDIKDFESNYETLIKTLPLEKTVFANTPDVVNRTQYQRVFQKLADENNLNVAEVYENVYLHRNDPFVYGGDFFHPSSKGYSYWFNAFKPEVLKIINKKS